MMYKEPDEIGIAQFYKLSHIMRTREADTASRLEEFTREITHAARKLEEEQAELIQINSAMLQEIRVAKRQNPLTPITEQQQDIKDFMPVIEGTTFIRVVYEVVGTFFRLYDHLLNVAQRVKQRDVFLDQDPGAWSPFKKAKDFMASMFEFQINLPTVARYAEGIEAVKRIDTDIAAELEKIIKVLDQYYQMLNNRHVSEGMPIYRDAIMTDVALTIFANIDAHGEIEAGNKELSAYSAGKAMLVASSVKKGYLQALLREPEAFQRFIQNNIGAVRASAMSIKAIMQDEIRQVEDAMASPIQFNPPANYTDIIQQVQDLNAASVRNKESDKFLTQAEKYHRKFQDETMEELVKKILDNSVTAHQLMDYIIKRKAELHRHYQDENSFYVCKIGAGNPFVGEAPGALKVVPGNKPNVTIDDIKGSGFFDVKDFLKGIDAATRWHDLFLATSPSKKVDKNNILLIGPMGCIAEGTFIRYEVRDYDGNRVNHKGGKVERLYQRFHGEPKTHAGPPQRTDVNYFVASVNDEGSILQNRILDVVCTGENECFELTVEGGESIVATADHRFFTGSGYTELGDLNVGDEVYLHRNVHAKLDSHADRNNRRKYLFVKHHPVAGTKVIDGRYEYKRLARSRAVMEASINGLMLDEYVEVLNDDSPERMTRMGLTFLRRDQHVHHIDEDITNDSLDNLMLVDGEEHNRQHAIIKQNNLRRDAVSDTIVEIRPVGVRKTYDLKMAPPFHNYVANRFVIHNCGKSEAMRAVASEKKSIAIYAQGSDFLTCWKGEDVKNPKRLFEAAIKFRNESGRHVHILIDEVDAVLNSDRKAGDTNLTLEFQLLMDGIVAYPGLSVWGATNNPERIPMPMIRRFSKVLIVGELDAKDRVELLKHFVGFLPTDIKDAEWEEAAKKLDGATGDVIRKVADHLWRTKLTWLVKTHPDTALKLVDSLNQECKFDIADFDEKTRFNFKKKLGKHISVTAEDLDSAVDLHLKNIAIRAEIDSATETYERAKKFLAQIESGNHQRASGIITLS